MAIQLRTYQADLRDRVINLWGNGKRDVLAVMATGGGKTETFLGTLAAEYQSGRLSRALILAHRDELIQQPAERIAAHWADSLPRLGIVKADLDQADAPLIVASVQTLSRPARLERALQCGRFSHLVVDECFPAGTLVDGRPIENLCAGDRVTAFDERSGALVESRIIRTMRNPVRELVRVESGDRAVVCTPGHPFWTQRGWVPAALLTCYDMVQYTVEQITNSGHEQGWGVRRLRRDDQGLVYEALPNLRGSSEAQARGIELYGLRSAGNRARRASAGYLWADRPRVLLGGMQGSLSAQGCIGDDGADKPPVRFRTDEGAQSNARPRGEREDAYKVAGDGVETARSAWQWVWPNGGSVALGLSPRLGNGGHDHDWTATGESGSGSNRLQGRHRKRNPEDCHRGRRPIALWPQSGGRQEGGGPAWIRVDRVEVLESGRDGTFGGLCPDGFVYNLEVEGFHTYLANGFTVHNCHHATSDSYMTVIGTLKDANPHLRHLGVTATPFRTDRRAMRHVYEAVAGVADIKRLIDWGYLVPFEAVGVETQISLAGVATRGEDFDPAQLADVFDTANCFDLVVKTHQQHAGDRQALAFTVSVDGAYRLATAFCAAGIPAEALDGTTPQAERRAILARFRSGETRVVCNCNVLTEGFDHPAVSAIHMVAPTKSDLVYVQRLGRALRIAPGKTDALVLDYKPAEARNVVLAGDVLGRIRRDTMAEGLGELAPEDLTDDMDGERAGAAGPVNWHTGDPQTLHLRALNLLGASPFAWYEGAGWQALAIGETDQGMETLVIAPNRPYGRYELWLIAQRKGEYARRYLLAESRALGEVVERGLRYAETYGQPWAASASAAWKQRPASAGQLDFLRRLDVDFADGIRAGEAAARITLAKARRDVIAARRFGANTLPPHLAA